MNKNCYFKLSTSAHEGQGSKHTRQKSKLRKVLVLLFYCTYERCGGSVFICTACLQRWNIMQKLTVPIHSNSLCGSCCLTYTGWVRGGPQPRTNASHLISFILAAVSLRMRATSEFGLIWFEPASQHWRMCANHFVPVVAPFQHTPSDGAVAIIIIITITNFSRNSALKRSIFPLSNSYF